MKIQNKKIKQRTQFPSMEGCRAAAGWSESSRTSSHSVPRYAAPHIPVIASETKQSSKSNLSRMRHNI